MRTGRLRLSTREQSCRQYLLTCLTKPLSERVPFCDSFLGWFSPLYLLLFSRTQCSIICGPDASRLSNRVCLWISSRQSPSSAILGALLAYFKLETTIYTASYHIDFGDNCRGYPDPGMRSRLRVVPVAAFRDPGSRTVCRTCPITHQSAGYTNRSI